MSSAAGRFGQRGSSRAARRRGIADRFRDTLALVAGENAFPRREALAAIHRLAALAAAGVAIGDAVASSSRSGQRLLASLHATMRRGSPLSAAMRGEGMPFSEAEIAMIRAGERGGSTPRALALLDARLDRETRGRRRIASALAYPCILAGGAFGALCFLAIVVLPSFTTLYSGQHVELPWTTRTLLSFGEGVKAWGPLVFPAALGSAAAVLVARKRSARFALLWDRFALEAPLVGTLVAPRAGFEACSLLALLLEAGCEADEALALALAAAANRVVASRMHEALRALRHGVALSRAWSSAGLDRSGDGLALLEIAEVTGGYAEAFARLAALEEAAAEAALSRVCRLAEPAAVIAMAVAVGGGVLAVYQPMLGSASLLLGGTP